MFNPQIQRFAQNQAAGLLGGEGRLPFRSLIERTLPPYLWDWLNIALNPGLGGVSRVGNLELDFNDPTVLAGLEKRLMESLELAPDSLVLLLSDALTARLNFIIDPSLTIAQLVFSRQERPTLPGSEIRAGLEALFKVIQHWNPRVIKAAAVIQEYLAQQPNLGIAQEELMRLLRSAIEKDFASNSFPAVEANILILKELLGPVIAIQPEEVVDWFEPISTLLTNSGLIGWIPAIQVEKELEEQSPDLDRLLRALTRLKLYRERGVLKGEEEEQALIEEEVAGFTAILGEAS